MARDNQAVIIIKRVKKGGHAAHHGGAWKVAYADFVTAMMAFFLLLWLLNATTEAQKQGISDYFSPATISSRTGGAGGLLGGRTVSSPGAMADRTAVPSQSAVLEPTSGATEGKAEEEGGAGIGADASQESDSNAQKAMRLEGADAEAEAAEKLREEEAKVQALLRKAEVDSFEKVKKALAKAIGDNPELAGMLDQVKMDLTEEGLKIQIIDKEGRPMFPSASSRMFERTKLLLATVTSVISDLPNKVEISGYTDAKPFRGGNRRYGNWELSSDRANATRRTLEAFGLDSKRITKVTGRAERDPLVKDDPNSASNRRISIMLLHKVKPPPVIIKSKPLKSRAKPAKRTNSRNGAGSKGKKASDRLRRDWSGPRVR